MSSFEELGAQFESFGLAQESIDTLKKDAQGGARDDPLDFSDLLESLEARPGELQSLMDACGDIRTRGATSVHTPLLDYLLEIYEEAYRNEGESAKLSQAFVNRAKARQRRKRLSRREDAHRKRGRDYSARLAKKRGGAGGPSGRQRAPRFSALY